LTQQSLEFLFDLGLSLKSASFRAAIAPLECPLWSKADTLIFETPLHDQAPVRSFILSGAPSANRLKLFAVVLTLQDKNTNGSGARYNLATIANLQIRAQK
jgi:hypothetical protein